MVYTAQDIVKANSLDHKITLIHGKCEEIELPVDKVCVWVCVLCVGVGVFHGKCEEMELPVDKVWVWVGVLYVSVSVPVHVCVRACVRACMTDEFVCACMCV